MAAVLLKFVSALMSVIVFLSGAFPALFGGKQYINPYGDDVLIGDDSPFYISGIDSPVVISDYETAKYYAEKCFLEADDINEIFFENYNMVYIPVIIPNLANEVYVNSIAENSNVLEVEYSIVHDTCIGGTMLSFSSILVCTSKNITQVEVNKKSITVPFCVH